MRFSDMEPEYADDLWPGRILSGDVTGFVSIGGTGKGLMMADVGGRVTRGWPMPPTPPDDPMIDWDAVATPGYGISISLEDKPEQTVIHRLTAAGADLTRMEDLSRIQRGKAGNVTRSKFSINEDLGLLYKKTAELGDVRLVTVDPLMGAATSTVSYNQQVRAKVIEPLQQYAEDTGTAVVIIMHFTKGAKRSANSAGDVMDYVGGSKGIVDALRMVNVIMDDPTDPRVKVLQNGKNNGGAKETADRYQIVASRPQDPLAHIEWQVPPPAIDDVASRERLQARILQELIAADRPMTSQEMVGLLRLSYRMVEQMMNAAQRSGLVEKRRRAWAIPAALPAAERDRLTLTR